MKRTTFALVFMLIFYYLIMGWTWLPDRMVYVHKTLDPNRYFTAINVWAYITVLTMALSLIAVLIYLGLKLFDYLRK
jgi:hypothetical protein